MKLNLQRQMGVGRLKCFSMSLLLELFILEPHSRLVFFGAYFKNPDLDLYSLYSQMWERELAPCLAHEKHPKTVILPVPCPPVVGMSSYSRVFSYSHGSRIILWSRAWPSEANTFGFKSQLCSLLHVTLCKCFFLWRASVSSSRE